MVIAIDGPAGVGKSSIAKLIAEKLNIYYLNSGNFYRAVAFKILQDKLDATEHQDRIKACHQSVFEIKNGRFFLDSKDVEDKLHTKEIDLIASEVSSDIGVRAIVNQKIHEISENLDLICEGRDITTVVFPDAKYKFYFDAKPEIRAHRRFLQNSEGLTEQEILNEINLRDEKDKNKPVGSLIIAKDAIYIDTSYLTINEVCAKVLELVNL